MIPMRRCHILADCVERFHAVVDNTNCVLYDVFNTIQ